MINRRIIFFAITGTVILALGITIGIFLPRFLSSSSSSSSALPLINPVVTANLGKHFIINFRPLKEKMMAIQQEYPQKTFIYFDYLNNSSWIGLNERDLFIAASTVKVPLAMALFRAVEDGKLKLTDTYALDELDLNKNFGELYKVGPDKQFAVEELVKIMLEQSDNTATLAINTIFKKIGVDDTFADVYNAMGWEQGNMELIPADYGQAPNYQKINLKILSTMFLALYNAKYINPEHSQQILKYLDDSPFNDMIVAGVPKDIAVAHKIGISAGDETFSDCGIVYAPNRNYILCLGINGGDEKSANKFMAEVSKAAYRFVINH